MGVAGGLRGNLLQAAHSVVTSHGAGALYKGFRASLIGDVLGNALGFTAYEIGNRIYRDLNGGRTPPPAHRGLIGTCSAAVVLTLTLPLEVVRRRLQVQGLAGRPVLYRGTVDCIRQVLRTEGIKGFYAASLPSYLKVAPSIGCMYFLFEVFMAQSARLPQLNLRLPQQAAVAEPQAAAADTASS
jgi:solute carrier family 25 phosphate transporter 23/24/25/41